MSRIPVIARHKRIVAFKWSLFSAAKLPGALCKWRLKARLSLLGDGDVPIQSTEQGVISILLTATDSELQLAFTSSLFLESSSASPSLEAGPTKRRQQSCLLCSAQEDEESGQPWAVAVRPRALQRAVSGTVTCSNGQQVTW